MKKFAWTKLPTNHLLVGRLMYVYRPTSIWDFLFNSKNFEDHINEDSASIIVAANELPPNDSIILVLEDGYFRYANKDVGSETFYKILYDDKIGYIRSKYLFHARQINSPFP